MHELVAERERSGPFASLGDLAARVGARRVTLEQLAWSGACDSLLDDGQDRRSALWQLGLATPAETVRDGSGDESTQLALPMELAPAPRLRSLGRWQRLIADYSTSGVTIGDHALAILRERLTASKLVTSAQLARLPTGYEVAVAGLVIARQRPGTAKGTMFLLFEDEFGTVNLIVPRVVYERHRQLARAEPLLLARGRLERSQEPAGASVWNLSDARERRDVQGEAAEEIEEIRPVINVIVRELAPLERFLPGGLEEAETARVYRLALAEPAPSAEEQEPHGSEVGSSMRAAAPPMQSFGGGRRR
jgi:error-prone DNA polymerase